MSNMTPLKMTSSQVNKLVDLFRSHVEKHGTNFDSAAVQTVLGQSGLAAEVFAPFQKKVEDLSEIFTRTVTVNRTQTPLQAFKSITSHKQYLSDTVVAEIPLGTEEEVTLHFFPIKKQMTCKEYADALESLGLKPDPMAQAAYNQANPDFADKYPNGTQWQNQAGNFCCALWGDWRGDRSVIVHGDSYGWGDYWFACGVSK
jgi:hypothetical protein